LNAAKLRYIHHEKCFSGSLTKGGYRVVPFPGGQAVCGIGAGKLDKKSDTSNKNITYNI
jgi:hypothetical protein